MSAVIVSSVPQAAGQDDAKPTWWQRHRGMVWLWAGLVGVTVVGAFLRYWRLGYQAYWTDEAYTLNRIRGNFAFLLNQLSDQGTPQGFPPGWYALLRLWRIVGELRMPLGETYQPGYLRMLPAFFGTLTVPAMYLLGRQFTDRRGALLVALLTAVNPFLIYYSRDIKMYSAFWFFVALNMGLFLQWLNSPRNLRWFPLFVISGVFMTSMHPMAGALLALQLIFLLTRRRPRGWDVPLWVVGVAVMAVIPVYWYFEVMSPANWEGRISGDINRGMSWIQDYTDMSWQTAAGLPTSHILGYLWPVYPPDARLDAWFALGGSDFTTHLATRSWAWMAQWQIYAAWGLFGLMAVGLLPWRKAWVWIQRWRGKETERPATPRPVGQWWWVGLWVVLPTAALALTWIPQESEWREWVWRGWDPKPMWEPRYLGIIIPAWLLWLAASLRRLPLWPVRTVAIVAVTGVCGYSSLSNHLFYRNAPMHRAAEIVEKYIDPKDRFSTGVAIPEVKFPDPAEDTATTIARHIVPLSTEDTLYMPYVARGSTGNRDPSFWPLNMETEFAVERWLRSAVANNPRIKTVVVTDRYGDITDKGDILSDEKVKEILGPRWTLVDKEVYTWHYEWRFYIFHTWRTRVYKLTSTLPATGPAATGK